MRTTPLTGAAGAVDYLGIVGAHLPPVRFFDSRGQTGELSRTALPDDARAAAAGLAHHGITRGDRVVLLARPAPATSPSCSPAY